MPSAKLQFCSSVIPYLVHHWLTMTDSRSHESEDVASTGPQTSSRQPGEIARSYDSQEDHLAPGRLHTNDEAEPSEM